MRFAIIDAHGVVINVLLAGDLASAPVPSGMRPIECDGAGAAPGDRWTEGGFVRQPVAETTVEPAIVRRTRLLEALDLEGRRADWEKAVASSKQTTRDYWSCEPQVARSNPKMQRVAARCGVDWQQLFDSAATL